MNIEEVGGLTFSVKPEKIINYLLNAEHPQGKHKAAFLLRFGYDLGAWQALRSSLVGHARNMPPVSIARAEFGWKFVYEGRLRSPDGRNPNVRTIWQVDDGETDARFITLKPLPR